MRRTRLISNGGFTFVEMILAITTLAILGAVMISNMESYSDAERYEATRAQMDQIRVAILGDNATNSQGHRTHFGYVGDWGSLPSSLSNLTTSQAPVWTFNSTYGFGAGWNGTYINNAFTTGFSMTQDAWGNNLVYSPAASPPSLTSYGSDGAAGGTSYAEDLVMTFPTNLWQATVSGYVLDGSTGISGKTVEIRYPANGSITSSTATSAADGSFSFSAIPFGIHSIAVTSAPTIGPKQLIVDNSYLQVPNDALNYMGWLQRLLYVGGSRVVGAGCGTGGSNMICVNLTNTYLVDLNLKYIAVTSPNQNNLYVKKITVNGQALTLATCTNPGANTDVSSAAMTIPTNTTKSMEIDFDNNSACGATQNINANTTFDVNFVFSNISNTNTVAF